jgi:predicted phosphodiesterase
VKLFNRLMFSVALLGFVVGTAAGGEPGLAAEPFTFVQVSDPQLGWGYGYDNDVNSLKQAVSHINGLKPDLVVFCGDMVNSFNDSSVADFLQISGELTMPSYCAPGNHDVGNSPTVSSLERYRQAFGPDYFSFEHKGYTFAIVNTSLWKAPLAGESEKQDEWLRQTLAAAHDKNSPVFIVGHHPFYLTSPNEAEEYYNLPPAKRIELLDLFKESGVVAVLGGHRHLLVINEYMGIQMVNGEVTCRHFDGSPLGFRLWNVDSPTSIRHEFRPLVPETPTVDFNGDQVVDSADISIMVDHWHEDFALCDIAPPPFGDGIVDVQDLILLSEHLFQDYRLAAYWKLDEIEGDVAHDSVSENDAVVIGNAVWQSDGGKVGGALQLDGVDDHISTPFVLNPADGDFSVFAWVKGGAPGQAIISQQGGADWLAADLADGALRTGLRIPATTGRGVKPPGPALISSTVVTGDDWHQVGFVREAGERALYVDDIEVARDTAETLESAETGLYIGAASTLEPIGFFSGLVDDVRIYDVALSTEEIKALKQ